MSASLPITTCGACLSTPPPLARCVAAVDYGWPWRALLARYKFQGHSGWASALAARMRTSPGATEVLTVADRVLPMPLSNERLAERGHLQRDTASGDACAFAKISIWRM